MATVQIECTDGSAIMSRYLLQAKFDVFEVKFESYSIPFTKRELALAFIFNVEKFLPKSVQHRLRLLNIMNFLGLKNNCSESYMFTDMLLESFGTSPAFTSHLDAWHHIWEDLEGDINDDDDDDDDQYHHKYPTISEIAEKLPDILKKYSIS